MSITMRMTKIQTSKLDLQGRIMHRKQDESDERDAGDAVGFEAVGAGADGIAGVVPGAIRNDAGIARVVFLDLEDDFHQVGADVGDFGEDAAGDAQSRCAQGFADSKADEARPGVLTGNKEKNEEHQKQLDADEHHADAHAGFERGVINRIRLAAQAGKRCARIRKGVHANAEPRHAVTPGHAD